MDVSQRFVISKVPRYLLKSLFPMMDEKFCVKEWSSQTILVNLLSYFIIFVLIITQLNRQSFVFLY